MIGTTIPGAKLEVSGTSQTDGILRLGNLDTTIGSNEIAGKIEFYNADTSDGAGVQSYIQSRAINSGQNYAIDFGTGNVGGTVDTKMTIVNDGNVGIGTTSPSTKLDVDGDFRVKNGNHQIILHDTDSGADEWSITTYSSDSLAFYENGSSGTPRFLLETGGNVGIGTTSPNSRLHIYGGENGSDYGNLHLDGSVGGILRFQKGSTNQWGFLTTHPGTGAIGLYDYDEDSSSSAGYRMVWGTNGNVGIGTSSPATDLDVDSSNYGIVVSDGSSTNTDLYISNNGANVTIGRNVKTKPGSWANENTAAASSFISFETNGDVMFNTRAASATPAYGSTKMMIKESGNVGIGTNNPLHPLQVTSKVTNGGDTGLMLSSSDTAWGVGSSDGISLDFAQGNITTGRIKNEVVSGSGQFDLTFYTYSGGLSSSPNVTFAASGNVGIGTTSPTAKLHVNGSYAYTAPAFAWYAFDGVANNTSPSSASESSGGSIDVSILASNRVVASEFNATSDIRKKQDINPVSTDLANHFLNSVEAKRFQWKDSKKYSYGFISQDIAKSGFGEMITPVPDDNMYFHIDDDGFESPEGYRLMMNYDQVAPLLLKSIQDNRSRLNKLNDTFSITNSNVGIGTASPAGKLHITGGNIVHQYSTTDGNEYGFLGSTDQFHITENAYYDGGWKSREGSRAAAIVQTHVNGGSAFRVDVDTTVSAADEGLSPTNLFAVRTDGNVGIGTTSPNASALLDVSSTTKGFAPPRMTTTQRDAISSPVAGLQIYNTTTSNINYYDGSSWQALNGQAKYIKLGMSVVQSVNNTDDITFDTTRSSNGITTTGNGIDLKAGVTYRIEAALNTFNGSGVDQFVGYRLHNGTSYFGESAYTVETDGGGQYSFKSQILEFYTPASDVTVTVRVFDDAIGTGTITNNWNTYFIATEMIGAGAGGGADHLGNHTATQNIQVGTNFISNDGGASEGLSFDTTGNATFTGTVTGASFSGSGANLTNIPTAAIDNNAITVDKVDFASSNGKKWEVEGQGMKLLFRFIKMEQIRP